jgi:hypothetical protein
MIKNMKHQTEFISSARSTSASVCGRGCLSTTRALNAGVALAIGVDFPKEDAGGFATICAPGLRSMTLPSTASFLARGGGMLGANFLGSAVGCVGYMKAVNQRSTNGMNRLCFVEFFDFFEFLREGNTPFDVRIAVRRAFLLLLLLLLLILRRIIRDLVDERVEISGSQYLRPLGHK